MLLLFFLCKLVYLCWSFFARFRLSHRKWCTSEALPHDCRGYNWRTLHKNWRQSCDLTIYTASFLGKVSEIEPSLGQSIASIIIVAMRQSCDNALRIHVHKYIVEHGPGICLTSKFPNRTSDVFFSPASAIRATAISGEFQNAYICSATSGSKGDSTLMSFFFYVHL